MVMDDELVELELAIATEIINICQFIANFTLTT